MNLKDIRTAMFAQSDWAPSQSPEAITRVNGFINRAYSQLALEAPFLFFESKLKMALEVDQVSKSASDTIQLAGNNALPTTSVDRWTFKTSYSPTTQAATPASYTEWLTDRSWDGRIIEITDTDGTVYRNQIRHIWLDTTDVADHRWQLTLVRPWRDASLSTTYKFRIYTEDYSFPDDLIEMKSVRIFDTTLHYPVQVIGQQEAEERSLMGYRSEIASGIPRVIFRRQHLKLQGPSTAPDVVLDPRQGSAALWNGPEPVGTFEYVITYTWGKRDTEFRSGGLAHWRGSAANHSDSHTSGVGAATVETDPNVLLSSSDYVFAQDRYREPRYESSPSPVSTQVSVGLGKGENVSLTAVRLTLPNIEYALGFFNQFPTPHWRRSQWGSGIHVRIYRRRLTEDFVDYEALPYRAANLHKLDISSAFYLLAEMPIDSKNEGYFYDNGEIIPDFTRRLRDVHGYQTFGCYPKADKRYVLDVRCIRRPTKLDDDDDAPSIHAEAINVLIQRAMVLLYENMGKSALSQLALQRYQEELMTLSKRYADLRPPSIPVLRRMSRAKFGLRGTNFYRKWYTTQS